MHYISRHENWGHNNFLMTRFTVTSLLELGSCVEPEGPVSSSGMGTLERSEGLQRSVGDAGAYEIMMQQEGLEYADVNGNYGRGYARFVREADKKGKTIII